MIMEKEHITEPTFAEQVQAAAYQRDRIFRETRLSGMSLHNRVSAVYSETIAKIVSFIPINMYGNMYQLDYIEYMISIVIYDQLIHGRL